MSARHWQRQPPAPAAAPQQSDFSPASQHVDRFAGEQQDEVVLGVVAGSARVASDREAMGCVVIVLPFIRSVCAGLRRRRAQEDATQDHAETLTNVDMMAPWLSRPVEAISGFTTRSDS
jgi:orotidine-5'-phosphate decarboxylase